MRIIGLEYFNKQGKFIGSGEYNTKLELDFEIRDEIIVINEIESLPSLEGILEGYIYVKSIYGIDMKPLIIRV